MKKTFFALIFFALIASVAFSESLVDITRKVYKNKYSEEQTNKKMLGFGGEYSNEDIKKKLNEIDELKHKGNKKANNEIKSLGDKDDSGMTALHYLVFIGDSEDEIRKLLDLYKNQDGFKEFINKEFPDNEFKEFSDNEFKHYSNVTPLFYAALNRNTKLARILIDNDADANKYAVCTNFENKLFYKYKDSSLEYKESPLFNAVYNEDKEMTDTLLSYSRIDVNLPVESAYGNGNKYTVLFEAIWHNDESTVRKLLEHGADINYKAKFQDENKVYSDYTPLLWVLNNISPKNINVLNTILEYKPDFSLAGRIDYNNGTHFENFTPLFASIFSADYSVFDRIYKGTNNPLRQKLYIIDKTKTACSPLLYAVTSKKMNEEIINVLLNTETINEEIQQNDGTKKTAGEILLARNDISPKLRNKAKQIDGEIKIFSAIDNDDFALLHKVIEDHFF